MKIIRKVTKICILLFVGIALFILFSAFPKTALAVDDNIVVDNEHYVDYSSLDTTSYYREYAVTNREVAYKKSGDIFAFENGASVVKNDLNTLVFKLNLLKPEYEKDKVLWYLQSFVVYECSSDSMTATPIADVVISHVCTDDDQEEAVFFKRFQYSDIKVGIKQYIKGSDNNVGGSSAMFGVGYFNDGYDLISLRKGVGKSLFINGGNSLEIAIKGSSPYTRYFVRSTSYLAMEGRNNYIEEILDSSVVSVYDVLKNISMSETLDSLGDKKEAAEHIVYNFATQKVQIMYLKRIGTTPFATTARAYVDVPVAENEIRVADVKNALGLDTMAVMQSSCDYFKYDSAEDIYRAYYYKSVWLSAKTADGNNQDLYLDCNLSFKDFYEPLVRDGILPIGDDGYEYFFNRMKYNFPELEGLKEHEVYGYFGYVALPKTYTFSQLFFEVFDASKANYKGTVDSMCNLGNLSKESYSKLLNDYHYNFLSRVWNVGVGAFAGYEAYHYSFYVDSGVLESFIAHNGAKDMQDNLSRLGIATRDTAESVANFFTNFVKKLGEWFEKNKVLFGTIAGILLGIIFLSMLFSVVSKATRSSQKKSTKPTRSKRKKAVKNGKKKEIHKR